MNATLNSTPVALMSLTEMEQTLTPDEAFQYRAEAQTVSERHAWLRAIIATKANMTAGKAAYLARVKAKQKAALAQATGKAGR